MIVSLYCHLCLSNPDVYPTFSNVLGKGGGFFFVVPHLLGQVVLVISIKGLLYLVTVWYKQEEMTIVLTRILTGKYVQATIVKYYYSCISSLYD